jgi:hypothetical protein
MKSPLAKLSGEDLEMLPWDARLPGTTSMPIIVEPNKVDGYSVRE